MREPIISLSANEEINVIGHNCKYPLRIKNMDQIILNPIITTLNFNVLQLPIKERRYYASSKKYRNIKKNKCALCNI